MATIEVVYVNQDKFCVHLELEVEPGTSIMQALIASGIYHSYPETQGLPVGIYARQVPLDWVVKEGDRLELYRPLVLDPKESRRKKARARRG